jgi:rubrerythrin
VSAEEKRKEKIIMSKRYKLDDSDRKPTCQYCLADPRYTTITKNKERRCPVCGSDYTGPRRDKEYAALRDAELINDDDE